jgi:hypothetical protein
MLSQPEAISRFGEEIAATGVRNTGRATTSDKKALLFNTLLSGQV